MKLRNIRSEEGEKMNINIPIPSGVQDDLRTMISNLAHEVIQEVKGQEAISKPYMSIKETCSYLNISFGTLQKFERLGLKKITIDGKILFQKKTIDEFMKTYEN